MAFQVWSKFFKRIENMYKFIVVILCFCVSLYNGQYTDIIHTGPTVSIPTTPPPTTPTPLPPFIPPTGPTIIMDITSPPDWTVPTGPDIDFEVSKPSNWNVTSLLGPVVNIIIPPSFPWTVVNNGPEFEFLCEDSEIHCPEPNPQPL